MNTEPLTTKCYACFSEIVFEAGEKQKRCSYCGRMNDRPRIKPESKEQLENALLIHKTGEFDAAKNQYQLIMNDNPNDYLSKWGWLLCQYGVIYVEDEWENKKERRVTCRLYHPSHFRDEPMYQDVLAKASPEVLADFIKDAEYIDSIQGEIQRLQNAKEKPYDIFICYKETAPGGGKTEDHEIAYRIYNELEQLNQYRVFYAPESMKGKVGANYEAVIFWAIEKSRVMLVLGTKKEYFESTWVHSE